ncbi:hypothetical protein [Ornithinimicrobium kibberense]
MSGKLASTASAHTARVHTMLMTPARGRCRRPSDRFGGDDAWRGV